MPSPVLHQQAKKYLQNVPDILPGYTLRVHERIQEGDKERIQIFEGLVISVHKGHVPTDASFVIRRIVSGVGVEKVFAIHSPTIAKIEVKKIAEVRRAKLFFLRKRKGKAARMSERFTEAGEFAQAIAKPEAAAAPAEANKEEAPAAEAKTEEASTAEVKA